MPNTTSQAASIIPAAIPLPAWDPAKPISFGLPSNTANITCATAGTAHAGQPSSSSPADVGQVFSSEAQTAPAVQQGQPSTSTAPAAAGWRTDLLHSSQAVASPATDSDAAPDAAATAAVNAKTQKTTADQSANPTPLATPSLEVAAEATKEAASKPATSGWGPGLLASNKSAAAKAAEAVVDAAKQQLDDSATATAPVPVFTFGLPPAAQLASAVGQQDGAADKPDAVAAAGSEPAMPPLAVVPHTSSPPIAIAPAKKEDAADTGSGSLVRLLGLTITMRFEA